jgi:hypothetical protein
MTTFIAVALTLAHTDRDYGIPPLEIVANAYTAGEDAARLTIEKLTPPKRPRKHK